jgi:hypothetical protein
MKKQLAFILCICCLFLLTACGQSGTNTSPEPSESGGNTVEPETSTSSPETADQSITVSGDGIDGNIVYTLEEMRTWDDAVFAGVYSSINNWPTTKFDVGRGITLSAILEHAGVLDTAQTVTFTASDGYAVTFTRSQIIEAQRYMYPHILDSTGDTSDAEPVPAIVAWQYTEDTTDVSAAADCDLTFMFGQENIYEHNKVAFVESLASITVSTTPAEQWDKPYLFPDQDTIPVGETVKLQHDFYGMVKIYYTTDGTDPTKESAMYNPSTYQPDLNVPITVDGDMEIRAFASGYGKADSDIAVFTIKAS